MRRTQSISTILALLLGLCLFRASALCAETRFSLDQVAERFPSTGFETPIRFWTEVFTQYSTNQVVLHDEVDLGIIYRVIEFERAPNGDVAEAKRQKKVLQSRVRELQGQFDDMIRKGVASPDLGPEQRAVIESLRKAGYEVSPAVLRKKRDTIRFQRGVRDKFAEGLARSGLYLEWIEKTFLDAGLPVELAALPHVESSFDYNAYSHAAAAGIWQFTRSTGRLYLKISSTIDERLDPIRATEAAARLLRENYEALQSWPLAVTSYNHGKGGMLRAQKAYGNDLKAIVDSYRSPAFGFASRNFYAEFLAALLVSRNHQKYFGELAIQAPLRFDTVKLSRSLGVSKLESLPGVSPEALRDLNPHLRKILNSRQKNLPRGLELRVPHGAGDHVTALMGGASASPVERATAAQDGTTRYQVAEGDTLSLIARRFGTSVEEIEILNGLDDPHRIKPGQVLLIGRQPDAKVAEKGKAPDAGTAGPSKSDTVATLPGSVYVVRPGDNLTSVARTVGVEVAALAGENGLDDPHQIRPGMELRIPAPTDGAVGQARRYTVQRGDSLEKIARRFGSSAREIAKANGIRDPQLIRPGQELVIP